GLLDLMESELVAYGTEGSNKLDDQQLTLAIRALEAVTRRLGMPLKLPFRNFTSFRSYWIRQGASGGGGWQARRDLVDELLQPTRDQLAAFEANADPRISEEVIAQLRDLQRSASISHGFSALLRQTLLLPSARRRSSSRAPPRQCCQSEALR